MIDEIFDRTYQSGRSDLNTGLELLFSRIGLKAGQAFKVLNRIEFDAPWLERKRKTRRA